MISSLELTLCSGVMNGVKMFNIYNFLQRLENFGQPKESEHFDMEYLSRTLIYSLNIL